MVIHQHFTHGWFSHHLGQRIPGAEVLPQPLKAHHSYIGFMLHHSIIKTDLFQICILREQILIIRKIDQLMGPIQHITQLISKNATIPKGSSLYIALSYSFGRFLLKGLYTTDRIGCFRYDITIFFTGIGRLHPHQCQIGNALLSQIGQLLQSPKIIGLHIGIDRTDNYRFISLYTHPIVQIGGCQCDGRKGITPARFDTDTDRCSQLIVNS